MSNSDTMNDTDSRKSRGNARLVGTVFLGIVVLLSAWFALAYFNLAYLQRYIVDSINPNGSILRVLLIATFGGFILSFPFLRILLCWQMLNLFKVIHVLSLRILK